MIPSSVPTAGDDSPNERIRIGMIGLGDRGKVHLTGGVGGAFQTASLRARKGIEIVALTGQDASPGLRTCFRRTCTAARPPHTRAEAGPPAVRVMQQLS